MRRRPFRVQNRARFSRICLLLAAAWVCAVALLFPTALLAGNAEPEAPTPSPEASPVDLMTLSLEELGEIVIPTVEGASRHNQSVSRAPAFVSVIAAEEIRGLGKRDLASILAGATGLYTRYDRNFSYLGVRGFGRPGDYNTHILVLIDGHRINDNVGHRVLLGSGFLLDVDMIDRIEVIRGPGSSLYGSNAILGVINIVTRSGRQVDGARASAVVGGLGTRGVGYQFGKAIAGDGDLMLSGAYLGSEGQPRLYFPEFDDPTTNGGMALGVDDDAWANVSGRFTRGAWRLSGSFARRRKTIPTAAFATRFGDPRTQTTDERGYLTLERHTTHSEAGSTRMSLSFDMARTRGDYVYDYAEPGSPAELVLNVDRFRDRSVTAEFEFERAILRRHFVTAGLEVSDILASDQSNRDEEPTAIYLDDHRAGWNYAAYLQDEFAAHRDLTLNLGMRFDRSFLSGTALSPRVGLVYSPDPGRAAKLLFGSAFRAPSPNELFYQDGGLSQLPSPDLAPERIRTAEFVMESSFGRHLRATLSAFHFDVRNLISETVVESELIQLVNEGRVRTNGIDFEVEGRWSGGVRTRCGYSYADAHDGASGERLVNAPAHLVRLGIIAPLGSPTWWLGVEGRASASVRTLAGATIPANAVLDLTLSGRGLFGRFEPVLTVRNATAAQYDVPGGPENVQDRLLQDGRVASLRLSASF